MGDRTRARALAESGIAAGDPVGWFDALYREAASGAATVPWDDRAVNPWLASAVGEVRPRLRVLDVGCGTGDNAAWFAARGAAVTAFDVSPTAIDLARRRFASLPIAWAVADARALPDPWRGAFDLVAEVYTLQVLPPPERARVIAALRAAVAPGGALIVVARAREPEDPPGALPWPLTRAEIEGVADPSASDLALQSVDDVVDDESPPVRRWVAVFRRPSAAQAALALLAAQVQAWNRGDIDGFCAGYADDAVYVSARGPTLGRAALAADYRGRFPDRDAMGALSVDPRSTSTSPGGDRVEVVARWTVERSGEPSLGGWALLVFAAREGGWRITHDATL